jgi:hypothetical protein
MPVGAAPARGHLQSTPEAAAHSAEDERDNEQDDCHDEDDLREPYRCSGDATEPEQRGDQSDDEKGYHEVQHCLTPQAVRRLIRGS